MSSLHRSAGLPSRRRRPATYRTRLLGSVVLVLLLCLGAVHLPWASWIDAPGRVGWIARAAASERIQLLDLRPPSSDADAPAPSVARNRLLGVVGAPPPTQQRDPSPEAQATTGRSGAPVPPPPEATDDVPPAVAMRTLGATMNRGPGVKGGLGSLYLNIEYPREARMQGIQGQVVLTFVVQPSGRTARIRVRKSLHPLCDSAAVRALRTTRFVPATRNGTAIPIHMQLPITFRLTNAPAPAHHTPATANRGRSSTKER